MADNEEGLFALKNPNYKTNKKRKVTLTNLSSFVTANTNNGDLVLDQSGGGLPSQSTAVHNVDFNISFNTERDLIYQYRTLAGNAEIKQAITDISNEVIVMEPKTPPVILNLDTIDKAILNDKMKEHITAEFEYILRLLNFRQEGDKIYERFYIDGRMHYHKIVDPKKPHNGILDLREIDPVNLKKIREVVRSTEDQGSTIIDEKEYYIYSDRMMMDRVLKIDKSAIASIESGMLEDNPNRKGFRDKSKVTISHLHQAIRPYNKLNQLEDAHLIYTISRAPARRVFYVDIANMNKTKGEEFMQQNMNRYKNKMVFDTHSGSIKNNRHTMSMLEDVWLPRKGGSRGTEVSTLEGGGTLGDLDLLVTFRKNLQRALNLPVSRLSEDSVQTIGRSSEITRDEVKFQRFVDRERISFSKLFLNILRTQLILKRIISASDWDDFKDDIEFEFAKDSYFSELKELEMFKTRFDMILEIEPEGGYVGKYFSEEYIKKHILRQTDEEIEMIKEQIKQERESGAYETDDELNIDNGDNDQPNFSDDMDDRERQRQHDADEKQKDREHQSKEKELDRKHSFTMSNQKQKGKENDDNNR